MKDEKWWERYGTRLSPKTGGPSKIMAITSKKMLNDYFVYSENKNRAVLDRLNITGMNEAWKESLRSDLKKFWWFEQPIADPKLQELRERLLDFCGDAVCFAQGEEDIDVILERGQFWFGHGAKMMKGQPNRCHQNSADLWNQNRGKVQICTGYALSDDGMWRQHSWLVQKTPRSVQIIETTEKRVLYFGAVLNDVECLAFLERLRF